MTIPSRTRTALLLLAAGLLAAGCGASSPDAGDGGGDAVGAQAAPVLEWTLLSTVPRGTPWPGTAALRLAERIEAMSGGRLRVRVSGAGELVPPFEVFDAVAQGRAEMGHGVAFYWRGKVPEAAFFTAVPFGMTAQEVNGWLYHGGGLDLWRELYAPFGLIPFPAGNSGMQMGGWFREELRSAEDFVGLRMRIQGIGAAVVDRAGGVPVSLPPGEVFTAQQSGLIDASEWVGPFNDLAFGLHAVAPYYYAPGWQEPGAPLEMIIGADAWATLTPDLQAIVTTAIRVTNEDLPAEYMARNPPALRTLVERHGVQLRAFPPDLLAELRVLSDAVVDEMGTQSPMAERIHASYRAYQRDVSAWHRVSEEAYLDARRETAPD